MKAKDFINICNNRALVWNHGKMPNVNTRNTFIINELKDKFIFTSDEIDKIVDDIIIDMLKTISIYRDNS